MASRLRLFYILAPPVAITYCTHRGLSNLEARYPALPADDTTCSAALRTPNRLFTQHTPRIDVYCAHIPLQHISLSTSTPPPLRFSSWVTAFLNASFNFRWAFAVFDTPILRWEDRVISLITKRQNSSRDFLSPQFHLDMFSAFPITVGIDKHRHTIMGIDKERWMKNEKQKLLLDILTIDRLPSMTSPYGLLVSWKMSDGLRLFFEKIARWGYPWRLMSGGRYEFSASMPFLIPGREHEGMFVEVRIASAHDYEVVSGEGDLASQKTIPKLAARLHGAYARLILAQAVERVPIHQAYKMAQMRSRSSSA